MLELREDEDGIYILTDEEAASTYKTLDHYIKNKVEPYANVHVTIDVRILHYKTTAHVLLLVSASLLVVIACLLHKLFRRPSRDITVPMTYKPLMSAPRASD